MQCAHRSYVARKELLRLRRKSAATKLQSIVRMRISARKVDALRQALKVFQHMQVEALAKIRWVVKGYLVRAFYTPLIAQSKVRRAKAAAIITKHAACYKYKLEARVVFQQRLEERRAELEELARLKRLNDAATHINRIVRGFNARIATEKMQREAAMELAKRNSDKTPMYYKLKASYFRDQNLFHRPKVVILQCFVRSFIACRIARERYMHAKSDFIKKWYKERKAIWDAQDELDRLRDERDRRLQAAIDIQRMWRGHLAIDLVIHMRAAKIVIWLCHRLRTTEITKEMRVSHKKLKWQAMTKEECALKIQRVFRGYIERREFKKVYKKLVRERNTRLHLRKTAAVNSIQKLARIFRIKKLIARRKNALAEEVRYREMMDDAEEKLEDIHDDLMTNLMGIRIQNSTRNMIARG
jgi:hypothetical protein